MLIAKKFGLILLNFRAKTTPLILCTAKWGVHNLHGKVGSTQSMPIAYQSTLTEPRKHHGTQLTAEWMTFSQNTVVLPFLQ